MPRRVRWARDAFRFAAVRFREEQYVNISPRSRSQQFGRTAFTPPRRPPSAELRSEPWHSFFLPVGRGPAAFVLELQYRIILRAVEDEMDTAHPPVRRIGYMGYDALNVDRAAGEGYGDYRQTLTNRKGWPVVSQYDSNAVIADITDLEGLALEPNPGRFQGRNTLALAFVAVSRHG